MAGSSRNGSRFRVALWRDEPATYRKPTGLDFGKVQKLRAIGIKQGFTDHPLQTRGHVDRLTEAFKILDEKPTGKTGHAMKGLVEEGAEAIKTDGSDEVRDACLIGAAQRVEYSEIAAYGTAHAFAKTVGEDEIAELLEATLAEEGETDKKLAQLFKVVNSAANEEGEDEEEES